jgi:hypothetical protein
MAHRLEDFAKPLGLSGVPMDDLVQTLAEDPPLAAWIATPPASDTNHQPHRAPLNREIFQAAQVIGVAGRGSHPTIRTGGFRRAGFGGNHPAATMLVNARGFQRALIAQQIFAIQCISHNSKLLTWPLAPKMRLNRPTSVDSSVEVHPFTLDSDVGFIHAPGTANGSGEPVPALLEFGRVMLSPSQNGGVRHGNAALAHHGHQIAVAQLVAEIPTNA